MRDNRCFMIWKIARKDLLLNLMTFKFLAGTIVCVVMISRSVWEH